MAEYSGLDQIWMMVTPHNPLKKDTLLDDYQRFASGFRRRKIVQTKPFDFEFKITSQPNYTVNTLAHLQDKFPKHEFFIDYG